MINKLFISAIIFLLICLNHSNGEIKGSWSKQFSGEIGYVAFSSKGDLVTITVNHKNEAIPENSTCEIISLKTSNCDILWERQILGVQLPGFSRDQKFMDSDNCLAVFADVLNTFEGTDYSEVTMYIFSRDGSLLWKLNRLYQGIFSPSCKYLAEFGEIEDEIVNAGAAKYRIIIRRTATGEIIDNIPVDRGVGWAKFVTDTTIVFTSLGPFLGLRNINSKQLTTVALDSSCDKYNFDGISLGDITRIVVICGSDLHIFNEKLNLLQKVNIEEVPALDSIPKNVIELYIREIGADYYFSSKGELLGDYRAPSSDSGESDINEFAKFVSKYRKEWSRYYNSADGRHIIGVLKDEKTIQYVPYVPQ